MGGGSSGAVNLAYDDMGEKGGSKEGRGGQEMRGVGDGEGCIPQYGCSQVGDPNIRANFPFHCFGKYRFGFFVGSLKTALVASEVTFNVLQLFVSTNVFLNHLYS